MQIQTDYVRDVNKGTEDSGAWPSSRHSGANMREYTSWNQASFVEEHERNKSPKYAETIL